MGRSCFFFWTLKFARGCRTFFHIFSLRQILDCQMEWVSPNSLECWYWYEWMLLQDASRCASWSFSVKPTGWPSTSQLPSGPPVLTAFAWARSWRASSHPGTAGSSREKSLFFNCWCWCCYFLFLVEGLAVWCCFQDTVFFSMKPPWMFMNLKKHVALSVCANLENVGADFGYPPLRSSPRSCGHDSWKQFQSPFRKFLWHLLV